ncbi:xyloglucan O-acetyltransferase [Marchantia polymorpha subsp. ruderalis]|uniref:Pectin O-acetyltransferase 2 n=1 Tax=Marchantia polymorpha TaxID=3197 RepID=A0A2R6X2X3_MARPO|nr:hypothetical protein MARPO_0040s0097 [Marchantia polymorpha]BBN03151.1 hypothetical protein Mp_2g21170 [Marchantia polymorpha subsp. ruderalis]|eukprot:PTQ40426.1 hypothetical protein MARPO_0040s0097 [Marchantia polymorpha]
MEYEKGLLTDRAVRLRDSSAVEEKRYTKTLKSVRRSIKNVRSMGPAGPCSIPIILSCMILGAILVLDLNQYVLGGFNCKLSIFNFQIFYPSSSKALQVPDLLSERPRHYNNRTAQEWKKKLFDDNDEDGEGDGDGDGVSSQGLATLLDVPASNRTNAVGTQFFDQAGRRDGASIVQSSSDLGANDTAAANFADRSAYNYADDAPLGKPYGMNQQLAQAGTQLLLSQESSESSTLEQESGSRLPPPGPTGDSSSLEASSGAGVTTSDVADVEETDSGALFLEESVAATRSPPSECDIFYGHWVYDETYPLYAPSSCPFVDEGFSCANNGRPDTDYLKWRWQPYDCDMPRFNGTDMLERLRNKRMTFVGDSLGRNQWESMLCMLHQAAPNKSRVFEVNGELISKHQSYLAVRYSDFNATVEFHRAPFLVHQGHRPADAPPYVKTTLHVDRIDSSAKKWNRGHLLVFNTGHWWTYAKTLRGHCYFAKDGKVVNMEILEAFEEGMKTWGSFLDHNINPKTTRVFFRSFSPTHFRGGQWNTGGQCNVETTPYTNRTRLDIYHPPTEKVRIAEDVISRMKLPVTLLNATELTDYRRDGHPSKWTQTAGTYGTAVNGSRYQDCSHWCLPGVPDTWNELVYASLLMHPDPRYGEKSSLVR